MLGFFTRLILVYSTSFLIFFNKNKRLILTLSIFLIGSLAGVFDRADFVHFQPSLPFSILATTIGVYQINRNKIFKIIIIFYLIIAGWWINIFYRGHISNKVLFFDDQTKLIAKKIKERYFI